MIKLLESTNDLTIKYKIIDITSIFEQRLSQGTRHIIHIEAYIARIIQLFTTNTLKNDLNDIEI